MLQGRLLGADGASDGLILSHRFPIILHVGTEGVNMVSVCLPSAD